MQNPFAQVNNFRQQGVNSRQTIQSDYLIPEDDGADHADIAANILSDANIIHPGATTVAQVGPLNSINSLKVCLSNQLFDPYIESQYLIEGFLRSQTGILSYLKLLHSLIMDMYGIAPLFLQGNASTTSSFRQGRLTLLLYPFMFNEKVPRQQTTLLKENSKTIGYHTVKKILSMLQTTIPLKAADVIAAAPGLPFFQEITMQQSINEIVNQIEKNIAEGIKREQFASNYADNSGSYVSTKVPYTIELAKLRALGYQVVVKVSGASFDITYLQTKHIIADVLPNDTSPSVKIFFQNITQLYKRYPKWFVRTNHYLTETFDNGPVNGADRAPQIDQNFLAADGLHGFQVDVQENEKNPLQLQSSPTLKGEKLNHLQCKIWSVSSWSRKCTHYHCNQFCSRCRLR